MKDFPSFKCTPFDEAREVHWGSDIDTIVFDARNLTLDVALEVERDGQVRGLRVVFPRASAIRYLDESDLVRYWTSDNFVAGHCVLEVLEGGWSEEENELQGFASERREWLVVTGKGCASVFSQQEPSIHEHAWRRDA